MAGRGVHNPAITWTPYTRVAWGGVFGATGEIWTNSLKWVALDNSVITPEQAAAAAAGVWTALAGWWSSSNDYITSQAQITWLKMNAINGSGLQYPGDTNYYAGAPINGSQPNPVPLYQTFALSLRTGLKRGRGHIGRIFPPTVGPTLIGPDGRCSVANASDMARGFAACMVAMQTALRTATSQVGSFCVLSPGNTVTGVVPVSHIITTVECDTVPDVQHRRTNRLARAIGSVEAVAG